MKLIRLSHRRKWASSWQRTISSCSIVQPLNAVGGSKMTGRQDTDQHGCGYLIADADGDLPGDSKRPCQTVTQQGDFARINHAAVSFISFGSDQPTCQERECHR